MTTLQVKRRQIGALDAHNNPVVTYADPVDWEVWDIAPGASAEPWRTNRDLSLILWTIYAPNDDSLPGELDRVVLDDVDYDVEGRAGDWTRGRWYQPTAGAVVELKRAEG
ncbi:MAG: hypothetical protein QM638_01235 [Nocardioides sp.]|uniref:hypothetical protein n=1 Tax=Nocardioides sp. TaxID=35761 RepID=UPI0039E4F5CC